MAELPDWQCSPDGRCITRSFVARNFRTGQEELAPLQWPVVTAPAGAAIQFFQRAADAAENAGHHPDLHLTEYRNVNVALTTHSVGGLTAGDMQLAAVISALPVEYSPAWEQKHLSGR